jgi:hypothetical protein
MTILVKPTFQMIGDTFLEEVTMHTDCMGEDFTQCDDTHTKLIVFLLVFYLIFSNIMLVRCPPPPPPFAVSFPVPRLLAVQRCNTLILLAVQRCATP